MAARTAPLVGRTGPRARGRFLIPCLVTRHTPKPPCFWSGSGSGFEVGIARAGFFPSSISPGTPLNSRAELQTFARAYTRLYSSIVVIAAFEVQVQEILVKRETEVQLTKAPSLSSHNRPGVLFILTNGSNKFYVLFCTMHQCFKCCHVSACI